jgi:hypothetical protein
MIFKFTTDVKIHVVVWPDCDAVWSGRRASTLQKKNTVSIYALKKESVSFVLKVSYPYSSLYLLTYGAEPFLKSRQLCSPSRTSQHFMEPEVSIPCSQEPSTGLYPEPYHSSLYGVIIKKITVLIRYRPSCFANIDTYVFYINTPIVIMV